MSTDKVLFADVEVGIHQLNAVDGSKTLLPGEFVPLSQLPVYQQEAALKGKIQGARVLTTKQAEALVEQAAILRGEQPEFDPGEEETPEEETVETPADEETEEEVAEAK